MEEWSSSASVLQETVRATVEAFAKGKISLNGVSDNAHVGRIAPSFISTKFGLLPGGDRPKLAYTNQTLGEFLGWLTPSRAPQKRVALNGPSPDKSPYPTMAPLECPSRRGSCAGQRLARLLQEPGPEVICGGGWRTDRMMFLSS